MNFAGDCLCRQFRFLSDVAERSRPRNETNETQSLGSSLLAPDRRYPVFVEDAEMPDQLFQVAAGVSLTRKLSILIIELSRKKLE